MFLPEPAVVHHEKLASHRSNVIHHLSHTGLADVEIDTFPAVQQDFAFTVTVAEHIFATPAVKIAASPAQSLRGVSQGHFRSSEYFLRLKIILGIVGADSGIELVIVRCTGVETELIVAAVAQSRPDYPSVILARFSIEGNHHLGVLGLGIPDTVLVLNNLDTPLKSLLCDPALIGPASVEMAHPDIPAAHRQAGRVKTGQGHRLLLTVFNFSPGLDHIHILVSPVADCDCQRIDSVLQQDARNDSILLLNRRDLFGLQDG